MNSNFKKENNEEPKVLFEDNDFIAVSKPAHMIVNKSDTSLYEYTLQDWAENNIKYKKLDIKDKEESDFYKRAGIVHRLDKETSGVILIAKNEEAFENLQMQFKNRLVKKAYLALCHGEIRDGGKIAVPVGRLSWNRKRFGVTPEGREAVTEFLPISVYRNPDDEKETLSLIKLFPKTGRTHQLRVHLRYINHPIYSDLFYAGRKQSRRDRRRLGRHFLHAEEIFFLHPKTKKEIKVTAPLPSDLDSFIKALEKIA